MRTVFQYSLSHNPLGSVDGILPLNKGDGVLLMDTPEELRVEKKYFNEVGQELIIIVR